MEKILDLDEMERLYGHQKLRRMDLYEIRLKKSPPEPSNEDYVRCA